MDSAFATPTEGVLAYFKTDATKGLLDKQVIDLRSKHGKNCMQQLAHWVGHPGLGRD